MSGQKYPRIKVLVRTLEAQPATMVPQLQGSLRGLFDPSAQPQTPAEGGRGRIQVLEKWGFFKKWERDLAFLAQQ